MIRVALLAIAAGTVLTVPAAPSLAAPTQASGCAGVAVVVDFASLGGGTQSRCAPGDPDSGVNALRAAGFEPTRAAQEAGYFVCRIDGKPADDPCRRASPADAYWSYWHAQPGGRWTFSNAGAAEYDPEPGSVEGWAFGAGAPPSTPPPAARQTPRPTDRSPAPAPSAAPGRTSAPVAAAQPTAPRTATSPVPAARPSASASVLPSRSASPSASPSVGAAASPAASASASVQEVPLTAPEPAVPEDSGSRTGLLIALLVVAALAAAGAAQAARRRA